MRRAAKVDGNQTDIVKVLRQVGLHVAPTHRLGAGFPDLVVTGYNPHLNTVAAVLVEIKEKGGRLTSDEKKFHADYPEGGPLIIAYEANDVLAWFGRV